ncbi:hypothetical protein [Mesorhizobium waimense]|nr:hypothetical protein [Mesorhizobium waimense]
MAKTPFLEQVELIAGVRREKGSLDLFLIRLTIEEADIERLLRGTRPPP